MARLRFNNSANRRRGTPLAALAVGASLVVSSAQPVTSSAQDMQRAPVESGAEVGAVKYAAQFVPNGRGGWDLALEGDIDPCLLYTSPSPRDS